MTSSAILGAPVSFPPTRNHACQLAGCKGTELVCILGCPQREAGLEHYDAETRMPACSCLFFAKSSKALGFESQPRLSSTSAKSPSHREHWLLVPSFQHALARRLHVGPRLEMAIVENDLMSSLDLAPLHLIPDEVNPHDAHQWYHAACQLYGCRYTALAEPDPNHKIDA